MANDVIPFFVDGDELTCEAPAGVLGGTAVVISGDKQSDGTYTIATATAGVRAFGIAMFDAVAPSAGAVPRTTVYRIAGHNILPIQTLSALAAGDPVKVGTGGYATKASSGDFAFGICMTSAAAPANGVNAVAEIALQSFVA